MQTPDQFRNTNNAPWLSTPAERVAGAICLIGNGFRELSGNRNISNTWPKTNIAQASIVELEPRELFGDERHPPTMAEMYGHSDSHVWPVDQTMLRRDVTDPDN